MVRRRSSTRKRKSPTAEQKKRNEASRKRAAARQKACRAHMKKHGGKVGSRVMVMYGSAYCTPGGLTKKDLTLNKWGRIVSKRGQENGRKQMKRLQAQGLWAAPYEKQ